MKVILFNPQIPQNTGNIIRTCFLTNTELYLVPPIGFSTSQKHLKRASLDYFEDFKIEKIEDLDLFLESQKSYYFFSSKATKRYDEINYEKETCLIFGSETSGLPKTYFEKYTDKFITIPMKKDSRCLNLSNSVSIALYEGLRQMSFNF